MSTIINISTSASENASIVQTLFDWFLYGNEHMNGQKDVRTYGRTDRPSYRDARTHQKVNAYGVHLKRYENNLYSMVCFSKFVINRVIWSHVVSKRKIDCRKKDMKIDESIGR